MSNIDPEEGRQKVSKTIREEVVDALRVGFGEDQINGVYHETTATYIYLNTVQHPLVVLPDDVILPDGIQDEIREGIILDVRTIIIELQDAATEEGSDNE